MRPQRSIDTISSLGPNIGRYTSDLVAGDIFLPPLPSKDTSMLPFRSQKAFKCSQQQVVSSIYSRSSFCLCSALASTVFEIK